MTPAEAAVRAAIAQRGPIPFDEFVDLALYHPGGFYATGGQAGRRGDFITNPEVGPLFGAVVARALDGWWEEAGRPDVFPVVEAGAGPGSLARSVLAVRPQCGAALRYVLVEPSAAQRAQHAVHLPLAPAGSVLAPWTTGPVVLSVAEPPDELGAAVVLANELLDNLPFGLLERGPQGWNEVRVGLDGDSLTEVLVPTETEPNGLAAATVAVGARVPTQTAAARWVGEALALAAPAGRVVVFDYASTTVEMAARPWRGWVRTYRHHAPGGHPLEQVGHQDVTCEVAVDQLPPPSADRSQADWLRAHGIDDLVEEGRATWQRRAAIGDLEAVRGRSRVIEAEALLDADGLGASRVLEWRT